ncbi:MAG: branched-chain amino acid ABC transporter permease [Caldilineaceae bacterium]|nr:branched-chain amino acid ABC transporter permease [Caldilineaceae bacterium]MDE0337883.1 branched-chain amino acid ABC transporter permease [Caldilineaceae bacterium]
MDQLLQALVSGLLLGGFYAVMVLGFSVIWGVMGVINLAHGEFLMIGAYMAWGLFRFFGMDPFASLVLILPFMFLVGYLLQIILINRIVERPHLMTLLVTFGVSIAIANLFKIQFTSDPRNVAVAYNGSVQLAGVTFPIVKTIIFGVALIIMVCLHLFLQRTRLGKSIRAAAQNKTAARIVGVDINRVYAITAGICIALTAAAGAMLSPTQAIFPFMGPPFTLKAVTITALGGLGRIPGALMGGMVLGVTEIFVSTYVPGIGTNLGVATSFILLVLILVVRPQGLMGGLRPIDAEAE